MWIVMKVPNHPRALKAALEGLTALNVTTMLALARLGHEIPSVYEAALKFQPNEKRRELWQRERGDDALIYKPEPPGREWWQTWIDCLQEGEGDCEDLAGYQAGYYRAMHGIGAAVDVIPTGRKTYHAVVRWPDGTLEDPSLVLGMPDPRDNARRLQRG